MTLLVRRFLILHRIQLKLLLHLVLKLTIELVFHLADGGLVELAHGLALRFFVDLLEFAIEHGATLRKLIVE